MIILTLMLDLIFHLKIIFEPILPLLIFRLNLNERSKSIMPSCAFQNWIKFAYRNTQAPEENDYYVGLTFYLFQVFPNPLREFIFTDITRSDANIGLILVFR